VNTQRNRRVNFETTITRLNDIVKDMEKGDLSLDESLKKFEEGINLIRECQSALHDAEQKVKILTEKSREPHLKTFENEQSSEDEQSS